MFGVCIIAQQILVRVLMRFIYEKEPVSTHPIDVKRDPQPKLNLWLILRNESWVENKQAKEELHFWYEQESVSRLRQGR